jgi:hypothetical protein
MLKDTSDKLEDVIISFKKVGDQLKEASGPIANIVKMFAPNGEK